METQSTSHRKRRFAARRSDSIHDCTVVPVMALKWRVKLRRIMRAKSTGDRYGIRFHDEQPAFDRCCHGVGDGFAIAGCGSDHAEPVSSVPIESTMAAAYTRAAPSSRSKIFVPDLSESWGGLPDSGSRLHITLEPLGATLFEGSPAEHYLETSEYENDPGVYYRRSLYFDRNSLRLLGSYQVTAIPCTPAPMLCRREQKSAPAERSHAGRYITISPSRS